MTIHNFFLKLAEKPSSDLATVLRPLYFSLFARIFLTKPNWSAEIKKQINNGDDKSI